MWRKQSQSWPSPLRITFGLSMAAMLAALPLSTKASEGDPLDDCYDASVMARVASQVPTVAGGCGEDCIVMSWPWIVQLEVEQMLEGRAKLGRLTVLTVQHTDYRPGPVATHWWLRRNTLGNFNVIRTNAPPQRCESGAAAAQPYVTPAPGRTLGDLRREGARHYGR